MITIIYPIQLPAVHKLVGRLCRTHSSEILLTLLNEEGYQLVTTLPKNKGEDIHRRLSHYSCLFRLCEIDD